MKFISRWLILTLTVTSLLCGMTCKNAQNLSYATTDALGASVDAAMTAFASYEVAMAKAKLGATASQAQLRSWVESDVVWINGSDLHAKYLLAYNAWISANKVAGKEVSDPQFRAAAVAAAGKFAAFVITFVPTVKPIQ